MFHESLVDDWPRYRVEVSDGDKSSAEKKLRYFLIANISKSEKISAWRADVASTAQRRAGMRGCPIWAMGWHLNAILTAPRVLGDRIASPCLSS